MFKIAHLADIHIQDRRRAEYAIVFDRLYKSLANEKPSLIVCAGDVFDNKMRASPHNMEDVLNFLTNLTKIAPVILIAGNHDLNCLTPGSLDLLTPLIADHKALQPPYLTYWRNSGIYEAHNIIWTVIATDGERPSAFIEAEATRKIREEKSIIMPHICLFHEEVNGVKLPSGMDLNIGKLIPDSFDVTYDLALGGHIHLRQRFAPRAAYCGSLVQQNIGEAHYGHGYVLWEFDLISNPPYHTSLPIMRGIDIRNDYGFVRIEIDHDGRDITYKPMPDNPLYWEAIYMNSAPKSLVDEIVDEYTTIFEMPPRAIRIRDSNKAIAELESEAEISLVEAQTASNTLTSHYDIIREILNGLNSDLIDAVIELHQSRWIERIDQSGGKFRIIQMEFDNMYAFGPRNVIDFTTMEGCVGGVIAPNHTGKSSLVETLLFALYDEHPRAPTKKDVIHRGAQSCRLMLEFELDGKRGRIEKGLAISKAAGGESQYRFEFNGENRTKGGTVETLKEIESVIGTSDSALASSFQLQGNEVGGFIALGAAGRKKLLSSVMSLGNFEQLEKIVVKELTGLNASVKLLESQYRGVALSKIEDNIDSLTLKYNEFQEELYELREKQNESLMRIAEFSSKITYTIDENLTKEIIDDEIQGWMTCLDGFEYNNSKPIQRTYKDFKITLDEYKKASKIALDATNNFNSIKDKNQFILMTLTHTKKPQISSENLKSEINEINTTLIQLEAQLEIMNDTIYISNIKTERSGDRPTKAEIADAIPNASLIINEDEIQIVSKKLLDAQAWNAAAAHLETFRNKLQLNDNCINCKHTYELFNTSIDPAELKIAQADHDAVVSRMKLRNNARSIIERANYWLNRDIENIAAKRDAVEEKYRKLINEFDDILRIENEYNLIVEQAKQSNLSLKKAISVLSTAEQNLYKLNESIAIAAGALQWWKNAADLIESNKIRITLNEIKNNIDLAQNGMTSTNKTIAKFESDLLHEKTRLNSYNELFNKYKILKAYRAVLKPNGGIGDKLLERARSMLEKKINEGLIELGAKFIMRIDENYDIFIGDLPASLGSGYQKFVLSLAARLAIWRLSVKSRPDAFIIDEGFGVCDDEYLESMAVALESLSSAPDGPKLVFVVSHVDALKTRLERVLEITIHQSGSQVIKGTMELGKEIIPDNNTYIVPDAENIGKVWCVACKQSLAASRTSQHINSAKHAKAVAKLEN